MFVHPATWKPASDALKLMNWTRPVIAAGFDAAPEGTIALTELLAEGTNTPAVADASRDDTAAIIYTSGTTGRPKGAMLTHGNILFNVESTIAGHGLTASDVHLLIVPLFHVTGLNTIMPTALYQGSPMVVSASIDPEEVVEIVGRFGCTTFFGVPTTFYLLANLRDLKIEKLKTLRLICYSGAPMSPLTIQRLRTLLEQPPGPGSIPVRASFGVAAFSPETATVKSLLSRAEMQLEEAKAREANEVVLSEPEA